jgi:predicted nucleic acid-binding Zn ribbon protein
VSKRLSKRTLRARAELARIGEATIILHALHLCFPNPEPKAMPIYTMICTACGAEVEVLRKYEARNEEHLEGDARCEQHPEAKLVRKGVELPITGRAYSFGLITDKGQRIESAKRGRKE